MVLRGFIGCGRLAFMGLYKFRVGWVFCVDVIGSGYMVGYDLGLVEGSTLKFTAWSIVVGFNWFLGTCLRWDGLEGGL